MWIWGYCAGYFKINGAIEWSFRNLWLGGVAGLPASSLSTFSLASKHFETTIWHQFVGIIYLVAGWCNKKWEFYWVCLRFDTPQNPSKSHGWSIMCIYMHHTYQKTLVSGIHFFTSKHWTFTSMPKSPSIGSSPLNVKWGSLQVNDIHGHVSYSALPPYLRISPMATENEQQHDNIN